VSFYARDSLKVARDLLGCELRHETPDGTAGGIIVETEAYGGPGDDASHARRGPTPRSRIMFGAPGKAYVYFTYGVHFMFNVVTVREGTAGAVLIRALEPTCGLELMRKRRRLNDEASLASGPGKMTQALGITLEQNGMDLASGPLGIWENVQKKRLEITATSRVGVVGSVEKPWRFLVADNPNVSVRGKSTERGAG
jgi:DNA-3-methyladenine glycosylase